jgi:Rrf2 family protein
MNTRFAVAVHILTLLAVFRDEALTSDFIASSVQTNAVVIRRILGRLREAGFVSAFQGPGGGFVLAVDPAALTLREVYETLAERTVIAVHADANQKCPVGRHIGALLDDVVSGAEKSMLASFDKTTVATLARRVAKCEKTG